MNSPTHNAALIWELSGKLEWLLAAEKQALMANDQKALLQSRLEDGCSCLYLETLSLSELRRRIAETEAQLRSAAGR